MKDESQTDEDTTLVLEPENIKQMFLALYTPEDVDKDEFIREVRIQIGLKIGPSEASTSDKGFLIRLNAHQVAALYRMLNDSLEAVAAEVKKLSNA